MLQRSKPKLDFKNFPSGTRVHAIPNHNDSRGYSDIWLEWERLSGETYYHLYRNCNDIRRTIFEMRIPDQSWQSLEPGLWFDRIENLGDA